MNLKLSLFCIFWINPLLFFRFLISGGEDGNLFVYKVNHAGVELSLPTPASEMLKEKKKEEASAPADDIDDVKAYRLGSTKKV